MTQAVQVGYLLWDAISIASELLVQLQTVFWEWANSIIMLSFLPI